MLPSQTNFVLIDFGRDATPIEKTLFDGGVIARPMGGYGLPEFLRISIGTREENERFLASVAVSGDRVDWTSAPSSSALQGDVHVPGDKSISHRAIMLAAIAEGSSHITGFLEGEDTLATARAFADMGVHIESPCDNERVVHGVGLHGLRRPPAPIDCGNAGTGMRLLTGLLAGQRFDSVLVGDASLSRRPMRRVMDPLSRMNARIDSNDGLPPLRVRGNQILSGIRYEVPVASAQVKSAILLAGLYARGETEVIEPHPTRDYTERMLAAFGLPIEFGPNWAKVVGADIPCVRSNIDVPGGFFVRCFFCSRCNDRSRVATDDKKRRRRPLAALDCCACCD